jgi:hypothetical protein
VKDENDDLLADSHNILNRWKNCFSQLLNVHRASDVRQIQIHTASIHTSCTRRHIPEDGILHRHRQTSNLTKYICFLLGNGPKL